MVFSGHGPTSIQLRHGWVNYGHHYSGTPNAFQNLIRFTKFDNILLYITVHDTNKVHWNTWKQNYDQWSANVQDSDLWSSIISFYILIKMIFRNACKFFISKSSSRNFATFLSSVCDLTKVVSWEIRATSRKWKTGSTAKLKRRRAHCYSPQETALHCQGGASSLEPPNTDSILGNSVWILI